MATNLFEYYKEKGQTLPTVQERTNVATQAGIQGYRGTAEQNTQLLSFLQKGDSLPPTKAPTTASALTPLGSPTIPDLTPTIGTPTNATASTRGVSTQLDMIQKQQEAQAQAFKEEQDRLQATQEKNQSFLQNLLTNRPSTADTRTEAFNQTGIQPAQFFADQRAKITEIDTLTQEYNNLKANMENQIANLTGQGRGIPIDLLNNQAAQIQRNAAPALNAASANINSKASVLQALQGNFNEARSFVDQAVKDATADQKFEFDTLTFFMDQNQDSINRLDTKYQNALNTSINLAKEAYDNSVAEANAKGELLIDAAQYGVDLSSQMSGSLTDMQSAYARGISRVAPELDIGGGGGGGGFPSVPQEFSGIAEAVGNLFPTAVRGNAVKASLSQAIAGGDYVGAYAQIGNAVEDSLKGTIKSRFANARVDYNVMSGLREAIQEYAAGGGDTGLLKGTAESIERKLGSVTDPKLAALAVQLRREFQTYRVNMTGAAFSPAESRDYDSVNPSSKKSLNLNLAVIDGAMNQLENTVTATINTKVPDAHKIYSQITQTSSVPKVLPGLGVTQEEEQIFDTVTENTSSSGGGIGGFFSNLWKGLTGK